MSAGEADGPIELGREWVQVVPGRWERNYPDGRTAVIERTDDGMYRLSVGYESDLVRAISSIPDADIRQVRFGKNAKYLAWLPGLEPNEERRRARVDSLLEPIRGHIAAGRLQGEVADDVIALMKGFGEVLAESIEAGRMEATLTAKSADLEHSEVRRRGAKARLMKNETVAAKAKAKAGALELWKERHAGKHPNLRTVEQFATEVLRRWPVLESSKTICGWSAEWTKQVKAGYTPFC